MRKPLRLALLAGAVLAGVTCTDAPTAPLAPAPGGSAARLSLVPSFSREAAEAWQSLAAFSIAPNNVHIVLKRPGPPEVVLKDTVITIEPGQTEISLELTVAISGPEEQLSASIQVRDGTQVLFEGTSTVTATRAGVPGAPPGGGGGGTGIVLAYVGPGASARVIRIAPRDQVVPTGTALTFSVSATDASGAAVELPPIRWSLSDSTLATIDAGAFTAGARRGTVTVRAASISGISDAVTIGIVPPASRVVTISGGGQTASAGKAVPQPFVVEVQAADGLPVPNVAIAFAASGDAAVTPAAATTDASGRASAAMTVGRTAGSYTFTATAGALGSTSVTATATPAPASAIAVVSGSGQSGAVKTAATQPLVVRVSNEFGGPVSGATVTWAVASGGGRVAASTSTSDADGLAQATYTFGDSVGPASVTATVATGSTTASVAFGLTATPAGVASLVIVSGNDQTGRPNSVLAPFVVRALDASGNPAAGFPIEWSVDTDGSLSASQTITDAQGTARVVLTLGPDGGTTHVTASAPPVNGVSASVVFEATVPFSPPAIASLVVSPSLLMIGTSGSYDAFLSNGSGAAVNGIVLQGYLEQGGTRYAAGGTTLGCNGMASPDGILPPGGCSATFSVSTNAVGLTTGAANFILEMKQGGTVLASRQAAVTLTSGAVPEGTTRIWTGAVDRSWHTAGNWSPAGIPTSSDILWIPEQRPLGFGAQASYAGAITLAANATAAAIRAPEYAVGIDVGDHQLTVTGGGIEMPSGSITSSTGVGSVQLSGTNPVIMAWELPATTVQNGAHLGTASDLWIGGNLTVFGGTFDLNGYNSLYVDGTFRLEGATARLGMSGSGESDGSSLYVAGSFIADGGASDATLLYGFIYVGGDFRQGSTYSTRSFAPAEGVYVTLQPAGAGHVSFASPDDSKFYYLGIASASSENVGVRSAAPRPRGVGRAVPPRLAAMREAVAAREAALPPRFRQRLAARATQRARAMAAMVVNPGVNFETSAHVADYLYLDAPLAVLNAGSTVTAATMYVDDQSAFDIASGATFQVTTRCYYASSAPDVPGGICPNAQYPLMTAANNLTDVFKSPTQSLPADFGVKVVNDVATPVPLAGVPVWFSLADNDDDACALDSQSSVMTDAQGIARAPVTVNGVGSCVIDAWDSDESMSVRLRLYAVPAAPAGSAYKVFIGAQDGTWSNAGNWADLTNPAAPQLVAPQPGDRVFISSAGLSRNALFVDAPASVGIVRIAGYATLGLGTSTLTVTDSIVGSGATGGSASVTGGSGSVLLLAGTNQVVGVHLTGGKLVLGTPSCSTQSVILATDLFGGSGVDVNCPVNLNGHSLSSGFDLKTTNMGSLTMDAASTVSVVNDASFGGAAGNVTGGMITVGGNLAVAAPGALQLPAATTLWMNATTAKSVTLPAATGAQLGNFQVNNPAGVQLTGMGGASSVYLYGGVSAAAATKLTILSGANFAVTDRVDVNSNALLTIAAGGTLSVPILSIGAAGAVDVQGSLLNVTSCAQGSQVTGPGKPASCPP